MAIDIDHYLTEIDPDNVCGEDLEYDAEFIAFEKEVQGKEEQIMGDSVIEAEPPNWREVIKQAEKLLVRTHDMRVYVNFLRALTDTQGIQGLSDGMQLLFRATEIFWGDIHPQLDPDDDNDPTERINTLMNLCDFQLFLNPLHKIPLVEAKGFGQFSLREIQIANGSISVSDTDDSSDRPSLSAIEGTFQACEAETLKSSADAASSALEYLNKLESFITEQVGVSNAASFSELRVVLKDINKIFAEYTENRGLNADSEDNEIESSDEEGAVSSTSAKITAPPGINNDQDVIKALNLICDYYKKNEPSSPIPLLLERVNRLVGKNFMEVMQDLAPDGVEQVEFLSGKKNEE